MEYWALARSGQKIRFVFVDKNGRHLLMVKSVFILIPVLQVSFIGLEIPSSDITIHKSTFGSNLLLAMFLT